MTNRPVLRGRVCVFGGAFDPFHNGHVAAIRLLLSDDKFSAVLVVPCGDRPDKPEITRASARYQMTKLGVEECFAGEQRVIVSDLQSSGKAGYATIDLVDYLVASGVSDLEFAIGSELVRDLPVWREAERLRSAVSFAVFHRPGTALPAFPDGWRIRSLAPFGAKEGVELSSTEIRALIKSGADCAGFVPRSVAEYAKALYT